MSNRNSYTVVFREGGRDRVRWRRMLGTFSRDVAREHVQDIARGGRRALAFRTEDLDRVGPPFGWDPSDREEDFTLGRDGFWWRNTPTG